MGHCTILHSIVKLQKKSDKGHCHFVNLTCAIGDSQSSALKMGGEGQGGGGGRGGTRRGRGVGERRGGAVQCCVWEGPITKINNSRANGANGARGRTARTGQRANVKSAAGASSLN